MEKANTLISTIGKSNKLSAGGTPRNHKRVAKDCEAGFTLMELIIVCTLAALFLSITIPTLRNNLYTNELSSSARKIIATVTELRNLAVREQKSFLLHFDVGDNRIWYEAEGNKNFFGDQSEKTGSRLPKGVQLDEVHTRSQGSKKIGSSTIWISKKGYMDQTVVYISDGDDKNLSLFFSPFSGSARVFEGYVEVE